MMEGANFIASIDALYSPNDKAKSLVTSSLHFTKLSNSKQYNGTSIAIGNNSKMVLFIINGYIG